MNEPALWFTDYNGVYESNEPVFFPVKDIRVAVAFEKNYSDLVTELNAIWQNSRDGGQATFGNYYSFDDKQFPPRSWHKMVFKVWGIRNKKICKRFPKTAALLDQYPEITSCCLTKTSPHSVIKAHYGESNAHIRIHLGLHVPQVDTSVCGMEVKGEITGWQNGKTFAFLDAHNHHVWNNSDDDRYILMVDVLRPEFIHRKYFICARVIVSQLFFFIATSLKMRDPSKITSSFLNAVTYVLYLPILAVIALNNRFGLFKL